MNTSHKFSASQKGNVLLIVLIIAAAIGGYLIYTGKINLPQKQVACTMDAKVCPDGTSVGRIGPKCEFKACPQVSDEVANWKTYTSNTFSFKYPNNWFVSKGIPNDVIKESVTVYSCDVNKDARCYENKNQIAIDFQGVIDKTNVHFGAKSIEDYYQKQAKSINSGKNRKDIILDNQPAIRFSTFGGQGDMEGVQSNGDTVVAEYKYNLYVIRSLINSGPIGKSENLDQANEIFNQILSTFKFTE